MPGRAAGSPPLISLKTNEKSRHAAINLSMEADFDSEITSQ